MTSALRPQSAEELFLTMNNINNSQSSGWIEIPSVALCKEAAAATTAPPPPPSVNTMNAADRESAREYYQPVIPHGTLNIDPNQPPDAQMSPPVVTSSHNGQKSSSQGRNIIKHIHSKHPINQLYQPTR